MGFKLFLLFAFLQCCTAVPHHFHHHNRYHRRRIPPAAHHGFRPPMHHPPADMFLSSLPPIIPYENKMHDFPMGGGNPLVDPSRSIRFRLYTRQNPHNPQDLEPRSPMRSRKTYFQPNKPTKILIHGALDTTRDANAADWMNQMRLAYLDKEDANVIVVDYTFFVLMLLYWGSLPNTYAYSISELAYNLSDDGKYLDNFHLIGRSWGAHVAGLAGQNLCGKIGRITGLDPANPPFRFAGFQYRLDKRNAKFVDVYHFNGRPRFNIFTAVGIVNEYDGLSPPLGHVDVYPNLRERQTTGCPIENAHIFTASCELGMGARLFSETIKKNEAFLICPCESFYKYLKGECTCEASDLRYMGEGIPTGTTGVFQMISKAQVKPPQEKPAEDLPASSSTTVVPESSPASTESTSVAGVTSQTTSEDVVTSESTSEAVVTSESTSTSTTAAPVTAITEIILSTEAPPSTAASSEVPPSSTAAVPSEAPSSTPQPASEVPVPSTEGTIVELTSTSTVQPVSESSSASSTIAELTTEASAAPAASSEASPAETAAPEGTTGTSTTTISPEQEAKANAILSEDGQSISASAIGRKGPKA